MRVRLEINVTRRCNKNCDFCYIKKRSQDLPYEQFVTLVKTHRPHQVVLTGGEALLHPNIFEMLFFLFKNNIPTNLFTNGLLLNDSSIEKLKKYNITLQVSYPEQNQELLKNLRKANQMGIKIITSTIFRRQILGKLDGILKDLKSFSMNAFLYPTPLNNYPVTELISCDLWTEMINVLLKKAKKWGNKIFFELAFLADDRDCNKYQCAVDQGDSVFIDSDGQEFPCCLMVDLPYRNIKKINCKRCLGGCMTLAYVYNHDPRCGGRRIPICPLILVDQKCQAFSYRKTQI